MKLLAKAVHSPCSFFIPLLCQSLRGIASEILVWTTFSIHPINQLTNQRSVRVRVAVLKRKTHLTSRVNRKRQYLALCPSGNLACKHDVCTLRVPIRSPQFIRFPSVKRTALEQKGRIHVRFGRDVDDPRFVS